ncbi:hypothetical protein HDK90DRAFT_479868 [Phyllosticta capitalensis]|uniref:Uncharacterized protein n=1 Tax=Phyllosticta capitalensis TaxID=121624 RepID=A0ABR1YWZ8_9PEZI
MGAGVCLIARPLLWMTMSVYGKRECDCKSGLMMREAEERVMAEDRGVAMAALLVDYLPSYLAKSRVPGEPGQG